MISLDFSVAIAAYTFIILAAVLCIWLFYRRQKERDLSLDPKYIWFCSICSYTYINTREEKLSVCPRCGSYNEAPKAAKA